MSWCSASSCKSLCAATNCCCQCSHVSAVDGKLKVDHLSSIGQVITVEDWSEVQVLARREGVSQREIALRLGISRVTVKRALDSQGPPGYERGPRSSGFDVFEAQVVALLRDLPQMPVTVVAQRIGWPGSITNLRRHVRVLRPLLAPVDPADRLE